MRENNNIKDRWLHLRLSKDEHAQLLEAFSKTTERKLSKYARNILLGEPMIAGYRNLTSEDLVQQFAILIKTLNGIANNHNQTVHKLHTIDHVPEIKSWLQRNEPVTGTLFHNIAEIKAQLQNFSEKWLRS
jgi:hypothetical protein